jgi:hypothetical protein
MSSLREKKNFSMQSFTFWHFVGHFYPRKQHIVRKKVPVIELKSLYSTVVPPKGFIFILTIFFGDINQYFTFLCNEWRILIISSWEAKRSPVLYSPLIADSAARHTWPKYRLCFPKKQIKMWPVIKFFFLKLSNMENFLRAVFFFTIPLLIQFCAWFMRPFWVPNVETLVLISSHVSFIQRGRIFSSPAGKSWQELAHS